MELQVRSFANFNDKVREPTSFERFIRDQSRHLSAMRDNYANQVEIRTMDSSIQSPVTV